MIWKKNTPFSKKIKINYYYYYYYYYLKIKHLGIYIYIYLKFCILKITKNMLKLFFLNDIFLEYIFKKISFLKIINFQNNY